MEYEEAFVIYKQSKLWSFFFFVSVIIAFSIAGWAGKLSFDFNGDLFGALATTLVLAILSFLGILPIMNRREDCKIKAVSKAKIIIRVLHSYQFC